MVFGERIKQLRLERKWTQEYVCEKLNISSGALSRYETSMYEPKSLDLVKDFADLFNVSTDYLLGKSDIRNPDELKKVPFANAGGLNTDGLDEEDLLTLQKQIDYIKKLKEKK